MIFYESPRLTKSATIIDTDKVNAQNFGSVIVFLRDSFRKYT